MAKASKKAVAAVVADDEEPGQHESVLDTVMSEVPAPKPVATGTWKLKAQNAKFMEASGEKPDIVVVKYVPAEPGEDVDQDELADGSWKGAPLWQRFRIEGPRDLYSLTRFFEKHGIDMSGRRLRDAIAIFNKAKPEIFAQVGIRTYQNDLGEDVLQNTLSGFTAVE